MVLTNHAKERLQELTPIVGRPAIVSLFRQLREISQTGDHAVVIPVKPRRDPRRHQWRQSDRLAAVVRNGRIVTVCLTRKEQCTHDHFRVESII